MNNLHACAQKMILTKLIYVTWNDIADNCLLPKGALVLYVGDSKRSQRLGIKNSGQVASSAFDTIDTACYDLREKLQKCRRVIPMRSSTKPLAMP